MSSTAIFSPSPVRHIRDLWFNRNRTKSTLREGYLFTEMRREEGIFRIPANFVSASKTPFLEKFLQGKSYYKRRIVRIEIRRSRYCELKGSVSRNSFAVIRLEFWHSLWGQFVPG